MGAAVAAKPVEAATMTAGTLGMLVFRVSALHRPRSGSPMVRPIIRQARKTGAMGAPQNSTEIRNPAARIGLAATSRKLAKPVFQTTCFCCSASAICRTVTDAHIYSIKHTSQRNVTMLEVVCRMATTFFE